MRRSTVALTPIVGLLVLGACTGDRDTTAPRFIAPTQSVSANLTLSCSFSTLSQDAKNYFPSKDTAFAIIGDMKTLYNKSGAAAATPKGFDVLARLADVRRGGLQIGSSTVGGVVVLDVVACMAVGPIPDKFTPAAALAAGVFEVRGASRFLNTAATALNSAPGQVSAANPLWGAEPANGDWTRSAAPDGYLVYGYPLGANVLTSGFELGTLPASLSGFLSTSTDAFRTGLCVGQAQGTTAANRLVHLGAIVTDPNAVLQQGTHFCVNNVVSTGTTTWLATMINRAVSLLAPNLAHAQFGFDGIGGLPDGWSPFNFDAIAGSSVTLRFGPLPQNVKDSTQFTLVVHASTTDFANVPGVSVALTIANNSGTPAQAVLIPPQPTAITDKNGDATFTLEIGKPGGYTLTATGTLSGSVVTAPFTSLVFNIKN